MTKLTLFVPFAALLTHVCLHAQDAALRELATRALQNEKATTEELVARALKETADANAVSQAIAGLNRDPSPHVIPLFRELFPKLPEEERQGELPRLRQLLAFALLNAGQKDEIYFEELAKYARLAVADTAPPSVEYDKEGNAMTDHLNPAFLHWCDANHVEPKDCKGRPLALDVLLLAQAKDGRGIPVLRQALAVENDAIVSSAVLGLAWLNDTASIPLIVANIQRFPAKLAALIASSTADFNDPRIDPLLDRFVTDPRWRQELAEKRKK